MKQRELDAFKRICRDSFGLDPDIMDGVYAYLHDFAYETTPEQAARGVRGIAAGTQARRCSTT